MLHKHSPTQPSLQPEEADTVIVLEVKTKDREIKWLAQGPPAEVSPRAAGSRGRGPQVAQTASQSTSTCHILALSVSYLHNEGWIQF